MHHFKAHKLILEVWNTKHYMATASEQLNQGIPIENEVRLQLRRVETFYSLRKSVLRYMI